MLTNLPTLIKDPTKQYFVGCDITHDRGLEIFAFSVAEKDNDGNIIFIHCDTVKNKYEYETDKKYLQMIESLKQFYNCPILKEVH